MKLGMNIPFEGPSHHHDNERLGVNIATYSLKQINETQNADYPEKNSDGLECYPK
jgi:hypothetical protein